MKNLFAVKFTEEKNWPVVCVKVSKPEFSKGWKTYMVEYPNSVSGTIQSAIKSTLQTGVNCNGIKLYQL